MKAFKGIKIGKIKDAQALVEFVLCEDSKHAGLKEAKKIGFKAECGAMFFLQKSKTLLITLKEINKDKVREAGANVARYFIESAYKNVGIKAFDSGCCLDYCLVIGLIAGTYTGDIYKKNPKKADFEILLESKNDKKLKTIIEKASIIAHALNIARDLVNTMPRVATPEYIALHAESMANELKKMGLDVGCKLLNTTKMQQEKMNALLCVAKASVHDPYLIHMHYTPKNANKNTSKLVLVGKGLTYDSGGLSLKPADYMVTMKADKSGGCALIGAFYAIAKLNMNIEVHGIIGAVENMIGGDAYKPDDVLFSREGKSIEVRNTDAEGRLVLADCLSYAQDLKPDILVDVATLTGACVVGLGEYTSGIMGFNEDLKNAFKESMECAGELGAILPFNRHIKKLLSSQIADICNVSSSRYGGAISAGMFLAEFIREEYKEKWLHLDIAGPAYVERVWDINPYGASGAGVRALVQFAKNVEENGLDYALKYFAHTNTCEKMVEMDSKKCCEDSKCGLDIEHTSKSKNTESKSKSKHK